MNIVKISTVIFTLYSPLALGGNRESTKLCLDVLFKLGGGLASTESSISFSLPLVEMTGTDSQTRYRLRVATSIESIHSGMDELVLEWVPTQFFRSYSPSSAAELEEILDAQYTQSITLFLKFDNVRNSIIISGPFHPKSRRPIDTNLYADLIERILNAYPKGKPLLVALYDEADISAFKDLMKAILREINGEAGELQMNRDLLEKFKEQKYNMRLRQFFRHSRSYHQLIQSKGLRVNSVRLAEWSPSEDPANEPLGNFDIQIAFIRD
jgi:hypothetical protein